MKKIKVLLIGLFIILITPMCVNAESYKFGNMSYELGDDYTTTTEKNIDTATYIPAYNTREELVEFFKNGEYSLFGINEDGSNLKFKMQNVTEYGNMASNKEEMEEYIPKAVTELREREEVNLVDEDTFTNKNGINYYTLEYFKFGSTLLDVTTSYNNVVYTFTLATSYSKEDIEKNAKEIMESVTLDDFKAVSEEVKSEETEETKKEDNKTEEKKNNTTILVVGAVAVVVIIGVICALVFKKK